MSAFKIFTAGIALLAPFVTAYTQPTGDSPSGNAFSAPGLGSVVPVGQDYTVQWKPSTDGTVTLLLLKGPANNLAVVGPIAENIANSGSFTWKPSTDLTAGPTETTGYGIELIVDATGQYQYTTQFGISNNSSSSAPTPKLGPPSYTTRPADYNSASSSAVVVASSWSSWYTDSAAPSVTATTTAEASWSSDSAMVYTSTEVPASSVTEAPIVTASYMKTSYVSSHVSSASRTSSASATTSTAAVSTGAASNVKVGAMGLVAAAGFALFAF